jgi:hypothetical protein
LGNLSSEARCVAAAATLDDEDSFRGGWWSCAGEELKRRVDTIMDVALGSPGGRYKCAAISLRLLVVDMGETEVASAFDDKKSECEKLKAAVANPGASSYKADIKALLATISDHFSWDEEEEEA